MAQCPKLKTAKTTDDGSRHSKWPIPLAQDVYFLLLKRRRGRRCGCIFFTYRLDILAITMLLSVAKLLLHRNKSTETEEVLLASERKGGLLAQPWPTTVPTKGLSHCIATQDATSLGDSEGKGGSKGPPLSGRETLLDKTLCSWFTVFNLLLFKLCDFSWLKRTVVESSRQWGVWKM